LAKVLTISRGAGQGSGAPRVRIAVANVKAVAVAAAVDVAVAAVHVATAVATQFTGWRRVRFVFIVQDNNGHRCHQFVVGQVAYTEKNRGLFDIGTNHSSSIKISLKQKRIE